MDEANKFTCTACKGTFKKGWTDEEALTEMTDAFGDLPSEDQAVVCDDCYRKMMP